MLVFEINRTECPTLIDVDIEATPTRQSRVVVDLIRNKCRVMETTSTCKELYIGFPPAAYRISHARATQKVLLVEAAYGIEVEETSFPFSTDAYTTPDFIIEVYVRAWSISVVLAVVSLPIREISSCGKGSDLGRNGRERLTVQEDREEKQYKPT